MICSIVNREMFLRTALFHILDSIIKALVDALAKYDRKNRITLYITIESLADAVDNHLSKHHRKSLRRQTTSTSFIHLPSLMTTSKALKDEDTGLLPLMKCLASVAKAVQSGFLRFYIVALNRRTPFAHAISP